MDNVRKNLEKTAEALREFAEAHASDIAHVAEVIVKCLRKGGKVLICGNGGSASQAQHFAAELVGRFEKERPGFSAVALTTDTSIITSIGNDYRYELIFARQARALGRKGDILMGISTSGKSRNVLRALEAAREMGMVTIGLTGRGGGKMTPLLDHQIDVAKRATYLIQEVHLAALHQICRLVEDALYDGEAH